MMLKNPEDIKLSKKMSWLLRHGAAKSGFHLQDGKQAATDTNISNVLFMFTQEKTIFPQF